MEEIKEIFLTNTLYRAAYPVVTFASKPTKEGVCHISRFQTCKAFLQDAVYARVHNTKLPIGINFYKKDTDKTRIAFHGTNIVNNGLINTNKLLKDIEKELRIRKGKIHKIDNKLSERINNVELYLFIGPATWIKSPVLLSLLTLIFRTGFAYIRNEETLYKALEKLSRNTRLTASDRRYWESGVESIKHISLKGHRKIFSSNIEENYSNLIEGSHNIGIAAYAYHNFKFKR